MDEMAPVRCPKCLRLVDQLYAQADGAPSRCRPCSPWKLAEAPKR